VIQVTAVECEIPLAVQFDESEGQAYTVGASGESDTQPGPGRDLLTDKKKMNIVQECVSFFC
jgi:hypothetical protein